MDYDRILGAEMTLIEKINYYAKGVVVIVGGAATVATVVVAATKDGTLDGGDVSVISTALVTYIGTVVGVIVKRNVDPPNLER